MEGSIESPNGMIYNVGDSRPPIDLVVVRETPKLSEMDTSTATSPTNSDLRNFEHQVPSVPSLSAYRLQPRGNPHMPTPSPSRKNGAPRGRKRGSTCLTTSLGSAVSAPQARSLFSSMGNSCPDAGTPNSSGNQSSFANSPRSRWISYGPSHRDAIIESPSRMENALQSLSLKSPRLTPASTYASLPSMKGRQSSPFKPYTSESPMWRPRGESLGSIGSVKTHMTSSTTRTSPKTAPLLVLRHDEETKNTSSPHGALLSGGESPMVVSLDPSKNLAVMPMTQSGAPPTITPKDGATTCGNDAILSTPVSQWGSGSTSSFRTPVSKSVFASPYATPIPKTRLRSRKQHQSSDLPMMMSPTDLQFSPFDSGMRHSSSNPSPSECVSTPQRNGPGSARGQTPLYLPVPGWHGGTLPRRSTTSPRRSLFGPNSPYMADVDAPTSAGTNTATGAANSVGQRTRPQVAIRSLLAAPPSPSALQWMAAADAHAAARDCDGSLTEDDDDEPFVLVDPSTIAEQREAAQNRPSQRRRMSMEDSAVGVLERNWQSTSSLLGMAFVQGEYNGGSGSHMSSQLSANDKTPSDQDEKGEQNFPSIGLDLEPVSMETAVNEKCCSPPILQERDLTTPDALEADATVPPSDKSHRFRGEQINADTCSPSTSADRNTQNGVTSSVYLSRSDHNNIHMTISKIIVAHEFQQSPPVS